MKERSKIKSILIVYLLVLVSLSSLFTTNIFVNRVEADWWNLSWDHYRTITVESDYIDSNLDNFPLLVVFDNSTFHIDSSNSIRFLAGANSGGTDNSTEYNYEIEKWDDTGNCYIWVNVTEVYSASDTVFNMYYNNSGASDGQDIAGTWDGGFISVWHMADNTTSSVNDSTSNSYHFSKSSASNPVESVGKIGNAQTFTSDRVYAADNSDWDVGGYLTTECWVKASGNPGSSMYALNHDESSNKYCGWYASSASDNLNCYLTTASGQSNPGVDGDNIDGTWHYCAFTYEKSLASNRLKMYVDDALYSQSNSNSLQNEDITAGDEGIVIGRSHGNRYWNMEWDETRISKVTRNASWIKASFHSQNQTTGFLTIGSERSYDSGWWTDTNWDYVKEITINSSYIDNTLDNFPILVTITNDENLSNNANDNGDDILFTGDTTGISVNGTKYNHEIEYWNDDGTYVNASIWVNVTSVSSSADTVIWMYYGNVSASNQENIVGTWNSNYQVVLHMSEASGDAEDSTSNNHDFADTATVTYEQTGKIGYGITGDDSGYFSNSVMDLNDADMSAMTVEFWFRIGDNSAAHQSYLFSSYYGGIDDIRIYFYGGATGSGDAGFGYCWDDNPAEGYYDYAHTFSVGEWAYVTAVQDNSATDIYAYLNETLVGTDTSAHFTYTGLDNVHSVGRRSTGSNRREFDGTLDEVRVSDVAHNASWVKACFHTQNQTTGFLTIGSEQNNPAEAETAPTVTTNDATGIEETNATIQGTLTDNGSADTTCYFLFNTTNDFLSPIFNVTKGVIADGASFNNDTAPMTTLTPGTLYYFDTQATNSEGWDGSGGVKSLLTKPNEPTGASCEAGVGWTNVSWSSATGADKYHVRYKTGSAPTSITDGTLFDNVTVLYANGSAGHGEHYFSVWSFAEEASPTHAQYSDVYDTTSGTETFDVDITVGVVSAMFNFEVSDQTYNSNISIREYGDAGMNFDTYKDPVNLIDGIYYGTTSSGVERWMFVRGLNESTTYNYTIYEDSSSIGDGSFTTLDRYTNTSGWGDEFLDNYLMDSSSGISFYQSTGTKLGSRVNDSDPPSGEYTMFSTIYQNDAYQCFISPHNSKVYYTSNETGELFGSWSDTGVSASEGMCGWDEANSRYVMISQPNAGAKDDFYCVSNDTIGNETRFDDNESILDATTYFEPRSIFYDSLGVGNMILSSIWHSDGNKEPRYGLLDNIIPDGTNYSKIVAFDGYTQHRVNPFGLGLREQTSDDDDGFYGLSVMIRNQMYLGLLNVLEDDLSSGGVMPIYLVYSRNGYDWFTFRTDPDVIDSIIPLGSTGEWDEGRLLADNTPLYTIGDEDRMYFQGADTTHGTSPTDSGLSYSTFRTEGLTYVKSLTNGWFKTPSIPSWFVSNFTVNAECSSTNKINISVINVSSGSEFEGFDFANFTTITTDGVSISPSWGSRNISNIPDEQNFMLNFSFDGSESKLYSYSLDGYGIHYELPSIDVSLENDSWDGGEPSSGESFRTNCTFWQNGSGNLDVVVVINSTNNNYTLVNYTDYDSTDEYTGNFTINSWGDETPINISIWPPNTYILQDFSPGSQLLGFRIWVPTSFSSDKREDFEVILVATEHT